MTQAVRALILAAALVTAAYAALGVAAALALSGIARSVEVARLRTLGLTGRQAVGLAIAEHGPVTVDGRSCVGGLLGVALFQLLAVRRSASATSSARRSTSRSSSASGRCSLILFGMIVVVAVGPRPRRGAPAPGGPGHRPTRKVRMNDAVPSPAHGQTEIEDLPSRRLDAPRTDARPLGADPGARGAAPSRRAAKYGDGAVIACDSLVRIYKVADLEVVALQGLDLLVDGAR